MTIPLLLIHGAESDRNQFADLLPALAPDIRPIVYDQRDTGPSEHVGGAYDLDDLADDAAVLLAGLGVPSAHVLGTSFGGAVAQHLALRHPRLVSSLTLVATTASHASVTAFATRVAGLSDSARSAFMLDSALTPAVRAADPAIVQRAAAALAVRTPAQSERRMRALRTHDLLARLGEITAPTLVLHGTDDPIVPFGDAVALAEGIPGAVLRGYDGGRHGLAFEFRDRLASDVSEFVRSVAVDPSSAR